MTTIPYALTSYGLPHSMGLLAARDGTRCAELLTPVGLMDAAIELGLAGVDLALTTKVPSFGGVTVDVGGEVDFAAELKARGLRVVAETGVIVDIPADELREQIRTAAICGAKVMRAIISRVLCGDRRKLEGGWEARLEATAARLREVLPLAEELGVSIAIENHQDATTADLIRLHERSGGSPAYGVTLDAGNPLAVGEEPVEAARRLAPLIRHLHLKDYTIHFAPDGFRLVRCAAGDGVVDFPMILAIARSNGFADLLPGIEIAAQATRTVPLLEPEWWSCYPERPASAITGALRVLWEHGRPMDEPYSSPWERGADSATVCADEWAVVRRSVEYFKQLDAGMV